MSPFSCAREREVTELLDRGCWPEACPADLRQHVNDCRMCSDLVLVSGAFQTAHKEAARLPHLEPAGGLWWRAQLRRRNAAIERVGRPILGAQVFALVISVVVAAAVLALRGDILKSWFADLPRALHLNALWPGALSQTSDIASIVLPGLATVALLSGVVVYFSTEKH